MKEESFLHFSVLCIEFFIIFATVGAKMQTSWRKKRTSFFCSTLDFLYLCPRRTEYNLIIKLKTSIKL